MLGVVDVVHSRSLVALKNALLVVKNIAEKNAQASPRKLWYVLHIASHAYSGFRKGLAKSLSVEQGMNTSSCFYGSQGPSNRAVCAKPVVQHVADDEKLDMRAGRDPKDFSLDQGTHGDKKVGPYLIRLRAKKQKGADTLPRPKRKESKTKTR